MAKELSQWLDEIFDHLDEFDETEVTIVSVVGKESAEHSKSEALNLFLERSVFGSSWSSSDGTTHIEGYYSTEYRAVFLILHGITDLSTLVSAFSEGEDDDTSSNFYAKIASLEEEYNRHLHFLFLISHIVLFADLGCRFDVTHAKSLSTVSQLRKLKKEFVCSALAELEDLPESFVNEGRVAVPRLLFLFDRNPLRAELGVSKKKELLEKMQASIERQILSILRAYRVIISHSRSCIGCVSDDRFVHVNANCGWTLDPVKDIMYPCAVGDLIERDGFTEEERKVKRAGDELERFLRFHLDHSTEQIEDELVFCNPTFAEFVIIAKKLYGLLITNPRSQTETSVSAELRMTKALDGEYEDEAFAVYKSNENDNESNQTTRLAYPRSEHEARLLNAKEYLKSNYTGSNIVKVMETLTARCEEVWERECRPCDAVSINGNPCSLPVHGLPGDTEGHRPNVLVRPHANMIHYLSCCNCGKSRAPRSDPFTIREANFDFYDHPQFTCCRFLERHSFDLFDPKSSSRGSPALKMYSDDDDRHSIDRVDFLGQDDIDDSSDENGSHVTDEESLFHLRRAISESGSETKDYGKNLADDIDSVDDGSRFTNQEDREQPVVYSFEEQYDEDEDDNSITSSSVASSTRDDDVESTTLSHNEGQHDELLRIEHPSVFDEDASSDTKMIRYGRSDDTRRGALTKLKKGSYLDEDQPITFRNATPVVPRNANSEKRCAIEAQFKGQYLEHMQYTGTKSNLLPLYPSWACVCIGPSSIYSHNIGMRDQKYMRPGSEFLLPLDILLPVDGEKWDAAVEELNITNPATYKHKRRILRLENGNEQELEKVKLFIGFDYECTRGHRFMLESPETVMKHSRRNGQLKGNATELLSTDLPVWMPCPCKKTTSIFAQLMRIHVVTPKAPVAINLDPKIQAMGDEECFTVGNEAILLSLAKYYILRLPFCYMGPNGAIRPPTYPVANATLLKNCLTICPSY